MVQNHLLVPKNKVLIVVVSLIADKSKKCCSFRVTLPEKFTSFSGRKEDAIEAVVPTRQVKKKRSIFAEQPPLPLAFIQLS